jgi:P4 family phage/plasmid primase-like protien
MDTIGALGGMLSIPQWFVWRLTWDQEEQKFQKMPCYPDGSKYRMNAQDPQNWQTFDVARASLNRLRAANDGYAYTLGFWLTADTGYWFFDIDKCLENGNLSPLASSFMQGLNGAAWEWSSSGQGLHIFGRGFVPDHRRKDAHRLNLEFYNDKRGIAFGMSGQFFGNADLDWSPQIRWLVDNYFPAQALPGEVMDSEFDAPCAAWHGPADDDELIALIRSRERLDPGAVFAGLPRDRATFSDLFDGNRDVLDRAYAGASDMDYALIGILSFWTGRDAVRTERIMRRSALLRDKWDTNRGKDTYIRYSILRQFRAALAEGRDVFGTQRTASAMGSGSAGATLVNQPGGAQQSAATPLVTIVTNETKRAAVTEALAAFAAAGDPFELEAVARSLSVDTRLDDGAREGLAHDLMERFEQLQTKRKITHCRAMVASADTSGPVAGTHRECTEFGNVARMMDRYGDSLMYVSEIEQWFKWDNSRWSLATPEQLAFLASETINSIYEEARNEENEATRAALMAWGRDSQKNNMVKNMVALAKANSRVFTRAANLDADPRYMGAPNGIIDLQTGALLAPDKNRRITQYTSVAYNPQADCPWFKQTVREAFFDDVHMVMFFKRLMGYTLMGNPKESVLVIPYGGGANGKSTIMNAISRTLNDYAKTGAAETFTSTEGGRSAAGGGPREDLLRLRTARLLSVGEVDESAKLREAVVKSLTGDDTIVARGVQAKASVEFKPRFVPVMSVNHRPIIAGDDYGIWRRVMMIPFERNFKKDKMLTEDRDRPAKIAAESEGVLRWLVEGALEYQAFGLNPPASVQAAHAEYKRDMDLLAPWIESKLEFDESYAVSVAELFMSWQQFAVPNGLMKFIGTPNALSRKLKNREGFRADQHKNGVKGRCWVGVRLRNVSMPGT